MDITAAELSEPPSDTTQAIKTPENGNSARSRPHLKPFAWSREKAIEAGRKGGKANGKAFKLAKKTVEVDTLQALQSSYEQNELRSMREEITRTRKQLASEEDPDKRFKLGCLLKKDWEIYQLLAGMPGPGTRKPQPERKSRGPSLAFDGNED